MFRPLPYYTKLTWVSFNVRFINVDLINVYFLEKRYLVTSLINVELKSVTIDSINAYQRIKKKSEI